MKLEHSFTVPVPVEQAWRALLDIEQVAPCMPGASLETVDGDEFTGSVKVKVGPINLTYKGKARFTDKDEAEHRASIEAQGKDRRGNGTASAVVNAQLHGDGDRTRVEVHTDLNVTGKPAQFGRGVMSDVSNKLIGQFADCLAGKLAGGGGEEAPTAATQPSEGAAPAAPPTSAAGQEQVSTDEQVPPADQVAPTAPVAAAVADAPTGPVPLADAAPVAPPGARPESDRPESGLPEPEPPAERPAAQVRAVPTQRAEHEVQPIDLLGSAGLPVLKRLAPVAGAVGALLGLAALVRMLRQRRHRR